MGTMTRFTVGQRVRSTVTGNGLVTDGEYEVVTLEERNTAFGNFVTYVVRELFGRGETVRVGNGHLLLTEVK